MLHWGLDFDAAELLEVVIGEVGLCWDCALEKQLGESKRRPVIETELGLLKGDVQHQHMTLGCIHVVVAASTGWVFRLSQNDPVQSVFRIVSPCPLQCSDS